ncbi:MAG: hypothetical protein MI723_13840 [Caulobacterales bacterium]|nr:hypothetical protein [Caulobacterales bacterium]
MVAGTSWIVSARWRAVTTMVSTSAASPASCAIAAAGVRLISAPIATPDNAARFIRPDAWLRLTAVSMPTP